jgi:outer membrane protein OmpA-like peptidoglycan-associated protein
VFAQKTDVRNSRDHNVLSRYPGSIIQEYSQRDYDQYPLALGVANNRPANVQQIEGAVTKISYVNPPGRSAFEIYKNYEDALKKAGFETLWTCAAAACGQPMHWNTLNGLAGSGSIGDIRYLTVRGKVNNRPVTVAMAVGTSHTRVHIVEGKAMDAGLVTASAAELAEGIDRDGHIPVYAIYFDTGKATLKPESTPALEQIAKLLQSRASLKLIVVGHTDNTGAMDLNMKLSADRAAAVMAALTSSFRIEASRLRAHGAGPLAPVASNRTEEGRAKNRRVDLVEQ